MVCVELEPSLSACVEILAKREYERTLSRILENRCDDDDLWEKLELLRLFLEATPFGELRSHYEPYLAEGSSVKFIVFRSGGKANYRMVVQTGASEEEGGFPRQAEAEADPMRSQENSDVGKEKR